MLGSGLIMIDKKTGTTTFYNKANSGLPDNSVGFIAIDDDGTKWIGAGNLAVYKEGGVVSIEFTLPKSEFVTLKIYNILGEEVATLANN